MQLSIMEGPLLITGASGQVGGAVARLGRNAGMEIFAPGRAQLDLTNMEMLRSAVASKPWSAIINCAAYTAVDKAESDTEIAWAVNANAPSIMAQEAAKFSIPFIQVSTDYVFDGEKDSPYLETDQTRPLGVYGQTKAFAEEAIADQCTRYAVVRTSWVLSAGGTNFLNTMLKLGAKQSGLDVVSDQIGCPSSADDIADALLTVASDLGDRSGIWHFVNAGKSNWFQLACYIFAEAKRIGMTVPDLRPIPTSEFPTAAVRPLNSVLCTAKVEADFGLRPKHWTEAVNLILAERLAAK